MDKRLAVASAIFAAAAAGALIAHSSAPPGGGPVLETPRTSPPVRPSVASSTPLVVYVAGAVKAPGVYSVAAGSRAIAAIKAAGGTTAAAELGGVNLAERLEDGEEVLVPDRDSPAADPSGRAHRRGRRGRHGHAKHRRKPTSPEPASPVDLNSADANDLSRVPGIGASLAGRIVAFRDLNGPFGDLDDLLDVGGMSQAKLDRASAFLRVR